MKAVLYTWKGDPATGGKEPLGEVRLVDGVAIPDPGIAPSIGRVIRDRSGNPLDPARGEEFIAALPHVFASAPYCWAELVDDVPDLLAAAALLDGVQ